MLGWWQVGPPASDAVAGHAPYLDCTKSRVMGDTKFGHEMLMTTAFIHKVPL